MASHQLMNGIGITIGRQLLIKLIENGLKLPFMALFNYYLAKVGQLSDFSNVKVQDP